MESNEENISETNECNCGDDCECRAKNSDALASEAAEYKEKWQRALADLENTRKRFEQDRLNLLKYSLEGFLEELIPVLDNFDRATSHVPAEQQGSPWVTGIQYIQKNLLDVMEGRGVNIIEAKQGDAFDAGKHEAIGTKEVQNIPEDKIAEVQNKGYMLHDRVLRPVQVIVSKPEIEDKNTERSKNG